MKQALKSNAAVIAIATVMTLFFAACSNSVSNTTNDEKQITAMLDSFNVAAAKADFNKYFSYYTDDAIFTGTDATERWDKKAFMAWAKPIFDKGHAWNFTALERHIYFDKTGSLAWFDELLNTQMKICRGSGVLVKLDEGWKIQQYVLSTTVPNSQLDSVIKIKAHEEDSIINKLSGK
ncbi:nuclear transport factor 2 family protein [Ferruginibacter sp. SUN106]|uniref:nuclear transport factor 2 family protein n=1 Tax=Ferruginibacter sp. SUN106 TaxID=2978348 RepID=UPI003D363324